MIDIEPILKKEDELRKQITELSGSGISIDKGVIIDRYVEIECAESLKKCETEEERSKLKKNFVEHYTTGSGKPFIDHCVNQVNMAYQQTKNAVENVKNSVTNLSASLAVPSVITVGSATSTSNPAWTMLDNRQKVSILLNILKQASGYLALLYTTALLIHLPIPSAVTAVGASIATITALVNAIPI